jgi:hypothetical protein
MDNFLYPDKYKFLSGDRVAEQLYGEKLKYRKEGKTKEEYYDDHIYEDETEDRQI